MIRIGLLDDHPGDLKQLADWIDTQSDCRIEWRCHTAEEAYQLLKYETIDLLIADIEMPGLTGYELAERLRSRGVKLEIIFVTGHSGYAVHAFDLDVCDYVMKPLTASRMGKALDRYRTLVHTTEGHRLTIQHQGEIIVLNEDDILFIERTGRSTTIFLQEREVSIYQSLHEIEQELRTSTFLRTHRSFVVNLAKIAHFKAYSKHSMEVYFQGSEKRALITKKNLKNVQDQFPILS